MVAAVSPWYLTLQKNFKLENLKTQQWPNNAKHLHPLGAYLATQHGNNNMTKLPLGTSSTPGHHSCIVNLGGTTVFFWCRGLCWSNWRKKAKRKLHKHKNWDKIWKQLIVDGMNMQTFCDTVGLSWDVIAVHVNHNTNAPMFINFAQTQHSPKRAEQKKKILCSIVASKRDLRTS